MQNLKLTTIIIAIFATLASCKKEATISTSNTSPNYYASKEYAYKIEMRKKAQAILTEISTDRAVQEEMLQTIDAITKKYEWRDEAVYFKEFLKNNFNTILNKPSITAQKFNLLAYQMEYPDYVPAQSILPGQTPGGGTTNNTLSQYLIYKNEEIYMPYHEDYSVTYNPTCTHQNLAVSETSNGGTIKISNTINNRTVTDAYAQTNACWIVGYFDDNREVPALPSVTIPTATQKTILDPVAVVWGWVYADQYHEGVFKGGPEYRLNATDVNIFGNTATAFPTTEIAVNLSRKDVKNKTRKRQYIALDWSWELLEINKRVEVYEDDRDGILSNIKNLIFPISVQLPIIGNTVINAGKQISNKDEDLGHVPYDRTFYYNNYKKNATIFQNGLDPDNWPFLAHSGGVYYSFPRLDN